MGLKILHSADWHMGSPFASFSPEQREFLKRAQRRVPGIIAELVCQENCDLVLLSGDIFDSPISREDVSLVYTVEVDVREEAAVLKRCHSKKVSKVTRKVYLMWLNLLEKLNDDVDILLGSIAFLDSTCLIERKIQEVSVGFVIETE